MTHKALEAWIKITDLVLKIYDLSKNIHFDKKCGFISQIKSSSVSLPSNNAVGESR
jgi:four helix bundle protein